MLYCTQFQYHLDRFNKQVPNKNIWYRNENMRNKIWLKLSFLWDGRGNIWHQRKKYRKTIIQPTRSQIVEEMTSAISTHTITKETENSFYISENTY